MSLKSRKFKSLDENKASVIRMHFKERKKTKFEERIEDIRLAQVLKEFAAYGKTESFTTQELLLSKNMNRNLENMFYDSSAFKLVCRDEESLSERLFMRNFNESATSERELFKIEKIVKEGLIEIDKKVVAIYENFIDSSPAGNVSSRIVEDPKTRMTISESYRCAPEGRGGLRLPAESVTDIKFRDCYYSYEETDWSNFSIDNDYSDPSAVYIEGRSFIHEVIREKNWRAKTRPARLTLICELPGHQTINTLNIHSIAQKPTVITSIHYEFPNGVWNEIEFAMQQGSDNQVTLFSPISTSKIKIGFTQYSPIYSGNMKVKKGGEESDLYGDRFELVIEEIWAQRVLYRDIGFFETEPIEVSGVVSFSIDEVLVDIAVEQESPFSAAGISSNALVDKYFIIKSKKSLSRKLDTVVPAPSRGREEELIALIGKESSINFCPKISENGLSVYKDGVELVLGSDFELSVDNGVTWINSFSSPDIDAYNRDIQKSSQSKIKILNPIANSIYTVSYLKKDKQVLDENGKVKLINGRIAFSKPMKEFSGEVSILYVLRSMAGNPLVTPLISSYFFVAKGKENA